MNEQERQQYLVSSTMMCYAAIFFSAAEIREVLGSEVLFSNLPPPSGDHAIGRIQFQYTDPADRYEMNQVLILKFPAG